MYVLYIVTNSYYMIDTCGPSAMYIILYCSNDNNGIRHYCRRAPETSTAHDYTHLQHLSVMIITMLSRTC